MIGRRILVVEDDPQVQALIITALRAEGADALGAHDVREAFLAEGQFDLLVLDLRLPNGDGRDVAQHYAGIPAVFITGYDQDLGKFGALNPEDVVPKPFTVRELMAVARRKFLP